MNKYEKEVLQSQLNSEKKTINELKQVYTQALNDCEKKIRELSSRTDMENLQSIIYQKQYQEAIKGQLEGVLANLQSNSFATVSEYLTKCYQEGYTGVMYDLMNQGIPIISPIDQKAVVKAVQTDSKIKTSLYASMGEDVKRLKNSIRAELSRGIANGSTWNQMAAKIAKSFKNTEFSKAYNNAVRIARTEGHRVQIQSALDAQYEAKKKGADVVKQWDSTLDGKTRDTHRMLDGQIREVDEDFEVGGVSVSAPGMFGDPAEDCNCRCALLQRARWALDEDELKTLEARAEYFGLDKSKDFEDFKEKYLNIKNEDVTIEKNGKRLRATDLDDDLQKTLTEYTDGNYSNICDYSQYITDKNQMLNSVDWFEKNRLPDINDNDKKKAEELLKIIKNQPINENTLYRIEANINEANKGDIITLGIRSATRDSDFANKVFENTMEGFNEVKNNGKWTEYRFLSSKSLDISDVSMYKNQEEELIAGKYEVVKAEFIKAKDGGYKEVSKSMKDIAENVEPFVSKSGKDMVKYTYDGKTMTDTVEKFESRTVESYEYEEAQFGRKIIWLKAKE